MWKPTLIDFLAVVRSKMASGFFFFFEGEKASLNVAPKLPKHCKTPPKIMNEKQKFCSFKKKTHKKLVNLPCVRKYQKTKFHWMSEIECRFPFIMAIQVVEFSNGGYKIRKKNASESTYSKEIIEFWVLD